MEAKDAPAGDPPDGSVVLPEGQRLDRPLAQAIVDALPDGTMFGFNSDAGVGVRTWMCVIGPGGRTDPALTREVLDTALASLDPPVLDSWHHRPYPGRH